LEDRFRQRRPFHCGVPPQLERGAELTHARIDAVTI
jgi:hypothetical protein